MNCTIKHITSEAGLNEVLAFARRIFGEHPGIGSFEEWRGHMEHNRELLLFAESDGEVVGIVFSFIEDNGNLIAGPVAVDERLRNLGVAREMMLLLEKRAKTHGVHLTALGAVQTAEGFYAKLGYTGSLLIQSEKHGIDKLLSLNTKYAVNYTRVYDGRINQVSLALPEPDRELQRRYEIELPGSHTQIKFLGFLGGFLQKSP